MSFPPSFLEEIRARLPLSEVVGKRVRLTRAGREYKACCPFHNEKSPSFYINDDKQFFHCFGCGAHGDVVGFTMRYERQSFPEAIENLAAQAGLAMPQETKINRETFDREKRLYQLLERTTAWFEEQLFLPVGRDALAYLSERGLNHDAIRRFHLGYAPQDSHALIKQLQKDGYTIDEMVSVGLAKKSETRDDHYSFFRHRVIFPVGDRRGRTVAFGGRVLGEGEPKYLNSPDHPLFHKGKLLYGLSRAREALNQNQSIVVVEGYMDVIAMVEAGFSGAVAPLGTALTEDQMQALWKLLPPLDARDPARDYSPILCFDGDKAGERAATRALERALPLLSPSHTLRIATITGGKDPDELVKRSGRSALDAVLQQAKPMNLALWDMAITGRRLQTPEDRAALTSTLKAMVGRITNTDLRDYYWQDMQERLRQLFGTNPQPQKKQQYGNAKPWGKSAGKFDRLKAPDPVIDRKLPLSPHMVRDRIMLATILNYPALFNDFGEDLAGIGFPDPVLEALRQKLVEILSQNDGQPLDSGELYRHMVAESTQNTGIQNITANHLQSGLAEVLSDTTYMHAAFARPARDPVEDVQLARQGWVALWERYQQEQLRHDLQMARRRYAEEASDENFDRLLALQAQFERMMTNEAQSNAN